MLFSSRSKLINWHSIKFFHNSGDGENSLSNHLYCDQMEKTYWEYFVRKMNRLFDRTLICLWQNNQTVFNANCIQIYISKSNLNFEGNITKCRINSHARLLPYRLDLEEKIKQPSAFLLTEYSRVQGKTSLEKTFTSGHWKETKYLGNFSSRNSL